MKQLIAKDPRNAERIFPYIGGEEVNDSPTHAHQRYVIYFADFPLRRDAGLDKRGILLDEVSVTHGSAPACSEDYPSPLQLIGPTCWKS